MTRTDLLLLCGGVVLFIALVVLLVACLIHEPTIVDTEHYTVRSGDTLWEIAGMTNGAGKIARNDIISDIMDLNELESAAIVPGQTLVLPVYQITNKNTK